MSWGRPEVNLNQTLGGGEKVARADGTVGRAKHWQTEQAGDRFPPASHPWTVTLIEKSMKNRWSVRCTPSLFLSSLRCSPRPLFLPARVTRSGLHAVLACARPAAHKVYHGRSSRHDQPGRSACVRVRQRQQGSVFVGFPFLFCFLVLQSQNFATWLEMWEALSCGEGFFVYCRWVCFPVENCPHEKGHLGGEDGYGGLKCDMGGSGKV